MKMLVAGLALALAAAAAPLAVAAPKVGPAQAVEVRGAKAYDFTSAINGRRYRVFVALPEGAPPPEGFPVVYVLDGNSMFATAADAARAQAMFREIRPAVIVGVGYPSDDPGEVLRTRNRDLTTPISAEALGRMPPNPGLTVENTGGVDDFLKVIEAEVKPLVGGLARLDPADQTLFGHSLGGLTVVRALFTEPAAFRTFVASSPSLFWNDRAVLADEPGFEAAVRSGRIKPRVLIEAGALEGSRSGYRTNGAPMTQDQVDALIETTRMVDNAADLGARLAALKGAPGYRAMVVIYAGESHLSVMPAATSRALNFALSLDGDGLPARLDAGAH